MKNKKWIFDLWSRKKTTKIKKYGSYSIRYHLKPKIIFEIDDSSFFRVLFNGSELGYVRTEDLIKAFIQGR